MAELELNSRYLFTDTIIHKGKETIGWWSGTDWINSEPSETIVVSPKQVGRPHLIANEYLGDPNLWWAIVYYNGATSLNWPRPGDEVKIPQRNVVLGS